MGSPAARIERQTGVPGLAGILAALPTSDLTSLLLATFQDQVARRTPASLGQQFSGDATVRPATLDARLLHRLDGVALDAAAGFEAVELSPVCPQGTNAVLGRVSQHNVLSTVRRAEVLADPTSALALECANRRRAGADVVRLCAVCRVLRLQPVPPVAGFTPHFRLLGLVTAARADAGQGFEVAALREHLGVHGRILASLGIVDPVVELADTRVPLGGAPTRAVERLLDALPQVTFDAHRREGRAYYGGPMIRVTATDPDGVPFALVDGGSVPWTQRLLANGKERLFISGIGLSLIAARWPNEVRALAPR